MRLEERLKAVFGYEGFRFHQKAIIERTLDGKDSLVIMPTGGGKSLCYQLPALIFKGITIVVSPLIALMKDQVYELRQAGIAAAYLNSSLSEEEQASVFDQLKSRQIRLIYVSPERLFANQAYFLKFLKKLEVSLIALDEAHCISQWGHDFRSDYLQVKRLKGIFPGVPLVALTATADKTTQRSIIEILNISDARVFVSSFDRSNIEYKIRPKKDSRQKLLRELERFRGEAGIIYCLSRKSTEDVSRFLNDHGFRSSAYHAGLSNKEREQVQDDFIYDRLKIVVATIAFGMGINKSNVRFVVHMDLPKNIESYYQETGRAGRDGLPSEAILFFSRGDAMTLKNFILTDNDEFNDILLTKLNRMVMFCESFSCRRESLLAYFGEAYEPPCGNCDNCLNDQEHIDGKEIAQKALSAVIRLSGGFGISYVIDFLRGSNSKKIKLYHKELKTYGVGKDLSKGEWLSYIHQLVDQKVLRVSEGKYPLLKMGQAANAVLFGDKPVSLIKVREAQKSVPINDSYDQGLFEKIRKLRTKLARDSAVPPYVIFSDKTIIDLCKKLPASLSDLQAVHGFGQVKISKYGSLVLEILNEPIKDGADSPEVR